MINLNEMEFDQAFSKFLDDDQYEKTSDALFELIRAAFAAGWEAAMNSNLKKFMDV